MRCFCEEGFQNVDGICTSWWYELVDIVADLFHPISNPPKTLHIPKSLFLLLILSQGPSYLPLEYTIKGINVSDMPSI